MIIFIILHAFIITLLLFLSPSHSLSPLFSFVSPSLPPSLPLSLSLSLPPSLSLVRRVLIYRVGILGRLLSRLLIFLLVKLISLLLEVKRVLSIRDSVMESKSLYNLAKVPLQGYWPKMTDCLLQLFFELL